MSSWTGPLTPPTILVTVIQSPANGMLKAIQVTYLCNVLSKLLLGDNSLSLELIK